MKYILRAIKYFISFVILLVIFTLILYVVTGKGGNIESLFRDGYNSLWKIGLMFAVASLIYPIFGYMKKDVIIHGEDNDIQADIISFMTDRGYEFKGNNDDIMSFRQKSAIIRLFRMYEDEVLIYKTFGGYTFDGARRDIVRLVLSFEHKLRQKENNDNI